MGWHVRQSKPHSDSDSSECPTEAQGSERTFRMQLVGISLVDQHQRRRSSGRPYVIHHLQFDSKVALALAGTREYD
jgi:hypothetical protein